MNINWYYKMVSGNLECKDNSTCPSDNYTCCLKADESFGCCATPNAKCCDGMYLSFFINNHYFVHTSHIFLIKWYLYYFNLFYVDGIHCCPATYFCGKLLVLLLIFVKLLLLIIIVIVITIDIILILILLSLLLNNHNIIVISFIHFFFKY